MDEQRNNAEFRDSEAQNARTERSGAVEKGFSKVFGGKRVGVPAQTVINRDGNEDIENVA